MRLETVIRIKYYLCFMSYQLQLHLMFLKQQMCHSVYPFKVINKYKDKFKIILHLFISRVSNLIIKTVNVIYFHKYMN